MPTSKKKTPKAKKYNVDPKDKLDKGLPWDMHIVIDPEVGYKIIAENEKTGTGYKYLVAKALKKAYGVKA